MCDFHTTKPRTMMPPGPQVVTISDSDEDAPTTNVGARAPHNRPRDKTSQRKNNGTVVDLTNDDDGPGIARSSMPNRIKARSPPSINSLSRMHATPRPRSTAAQLRAASPTFAPSDDEDELPDDPTPRSSFARPPPRSDSRSQPKVTSRSSLRNAHPSSPNKRPRNSNDSTRRQHAKEKRRRTAADEEPIDGLDPHAIRSKQPSQSHGGTRRSSPSKASAIESPSVAGAADESRAEASSHNAKPKTSANSQNNHRNLIETAEHRRQQRPGPRNEPTAPKLDARARGSVSDRSPDGASKNRQRGDPALTHLEDFHKAPSRNVDNTLRDLGIDVTAAPKQRKDATTVLAGTLTDGGDNHSSPKPVSPLRKSPRPDWTSAGASPSSQLHREAGDEIEEPDRSVQIPPDTELACGDQVPDSGLQKAHADEAIEEPDVLAAIPIFPVERQVERVLGKYYQEMREDTDYFTKAWLKRSRRSIELHYAKQVTARQSDSPSDKPSVASAVFARLRAAAAGCAQPTTATAKTSNDNFRFNIDVYNGANKPTRSYLKARHHRCNVTSIANDVPEYAHYVSLQTNMLAPNTTTMTVWPYFGDGEPDPEEFGDYYLMDTEQRHRKIRRLLEAQKVE